MTKVLVTGGAGFIGSHVVERFVARGDDVTVLDDLSSGSRAHLRAVSDRITFLEDRVENIAAHAAALEGTRIVVHLGALISSYDSLVEPRRYVDANIGGLLELLALVRTWPSAHVVFASSSTVYGNRPDPVRRETDVPAPINVYALSKLTGEHLLAMYGPLYGFTHTSLRLFNVYGPRQSPTHAYANVTCKFSHAAATGAPVKLFGDGSVTRDFVYVDDVVDAFVEASAGPKPHAVYNVGTGADRSIAALLAEVEQLGGRTLDVERCPPWPNDIIAIRADVDRLRRDFERVPRVGLTQGLAQTIAYFRARDGH